MKYYPIFISLDAQPCLVVGGGAVALRKIRLLRKANAKITVIAPEILLELEQEFGDALTYLRRAFEDTDIDGYRLITAATNCSATNERISNLAQQRNIPVNVVDRPELCSFITPSIIDRSPVTVAISTGGGAPVLARLLRAKLEAIIPASYGKLAASMSEFRAKLKAVTVSEDQRRRFWERVVSGPIAELFFSGRDREGKHAMQQAIDKHRHLIDVFV